MTSRYRPLVLASVLVAGPAVAHNEPSRARTLKAQLVQAHAPCTAPNTATSGGFPACTPEIQIDPTCRFGDKGSGTLTAAVKGSALAAKAVLKGLDAGCNGRTLTAVVSLRATTDDCPFATCTAEMTDLPLGTCTVTRGKCAVKGTVGPGVFTGNNETGVEVLGCGIKNGTVRTFSCGLLVP